MTRDVATYAYCLVAATRSPRLPKLPKARRLEASGPLRAIDAGDGLWLVCADVALARYGEEALAALFTQVVSRPDKPVSGAAISIFKPEAQGTLPIQPDRLKFIQDAMVSVVENPRGTANFRLRGLSVPVAGKTGTAESGSGKPHAWFAGYTMAGESTGLPDIAIAVILENQGEGSDFAAPIFKRMVESYYFGGPQSQLWFEQGILGPTLTPSPIGGVPTKTPKP